MSRATRGIVYEIAAKIALAGNATIYLTGATNDAKTIYAELTWYEVAV